MIHSGGKETMTLFVSEKPFIGTPKGISYDVKNTKN